MNEEQRKAYIAALIEERRGYEMYKNTAQLKAVDDELARVRGEGKPPAKRAQKR